LTRLADWDWCRARPALDPGGERREPLQVLRDDHRRAVDLQLLQHASAVTRAETLEPAEERGAEGSRDPFQRVNHDEPARAVACVVRDDRAARDLAQQGELFEKFRSGHR